MKQIDDVLYKEVLELLGKRSKRLYSKMLELQEVDNNLSLVKARETKSNNKKNEILDAIMKIASENISEDSKAPTKYQIHKKTKIAYVTINKYYDDLIKGI